MKIPTVTHTGTITICGVTMLVHRLDNGECVIDAESFKAFAPSPHSSSRMTEAEMDELFKEMRRIRVD